MNEQKIKEYIFQAHQAGKSETSGLVQDITKKVTDAVKEQVVVTVNGKIDKIKEHLEKQDVKLELMDGKIDDLKEKTLPLVQTLTVAQLIKKFLVWAAPLGVLAGLFNWIT